MRTLNNKKGLSMMEFVVTMAIFTIISTAGMLLFVSGENLWSMTDARITVIENMRQILQRVSLELQESGRDHLGNMKVSISDNTGTNSTDILRFSIPLCVCGTSPIDQNGNVKNWGAPLIWGQARCGSDYTLDANGKVTICHLPPGNPNNVQNLQVSVNAVKAHLAHGDRLGVCNSCDPLTFTNKTIEYLKDGNGRLLRRVLNSANAVINSTVFAENITDFQVSLNAGQTVVTLSLQGSRKALQSRNVIVAGSMQVLLRNR